MDKYNVLYIFRSFLHHEKKNIEIRNERRNEEYLMIYF